MSNKVNFEALAKTPVASELTPVECQVLAGIMSMRQLKDGEILVSEHGTDQTLFVLIKGKLGVYSTMEGGQELVYTMIEGECAGTRAFVDRAPRKATLKSIGDTTVYTMEPDDFESLLEDHPRIVYKVMRALFRLTHIHLQRMNQETQQLANYISKTHGRY
ncbi:MAG: Crp/Fnr family transcriptional regulator [Pseudomonadota bacterium]